MKKTYLRVIALILVVCAMQVALVPAVSAVSSTENGTAKPLPVLAQENVTSGWHDGVFCGVTKVNGHDYLALPIYGGKMYVYDLDELLLVDVVQTGIPTPRGATVDSDGNIWVTGDVPHLYCYNPFTHTGSSKSYADTIESGSGFAITQGDDGDLYFGSYPNGDIAKYNIATDTFTKIDYTESDVTDSAVDYATAVVQKGEYIYASMHDDLKNHYLVKLDAATYETVASVQVNAQMGTQRYLRGLQMMDENIIVGSGTGRMFAVNTDTMTVLTADDLGMEFAIKGDISEVMDNKVYFTDDKQGICQYDLTTGKVSVVWAATGLLGLRNNSGGSVTLNVKKGYDEEKQTDTYTVVPWYEEGAEEKECLIQYYNSQNALFGTNMEELVSYRITGMIDSGAGSGNGLRTLIPGLPGSNKLYIGAFEAYQAYVYDTAAEAITENWITADMQTDAFHWYNDKLYAGNYTLCQLIEMDLVNNEPTALFSLNDAVFDQARIHTITSGDNKVFAATIPDVYKNGGMIAWYDYSNNRAYAAVGPNPEDVYYSDNSELTIDAAGNVDTDKINEVVWTNEVTGEERTADIADSNGVNGVITKHSINCIAYYDGILFGTSSRAGGTSAGYGSGRAVLFAYDVENRKVMKTDNLSSMGFGSLNYIGGIAEDPDVPGKFWGVAGETLFSFTFNKSTNQFTFSVELSFSKTLGANDGGRYLVPRPILFADEDNDGVSDYIYVAFSENGNLCRIEKDNPANYEKLLPETTDSTDIPTEYALGEDGCLYYLDGANLYALNITPTDEEWEKAATIDAQIENLANNDIDSIYMAYNALSSREKSLVQHADEMNALNVAAVIAKINAIGTVTAKSGAAIAAARAIYDSLAWEQASQVTNYNVLLASEVAYDKLLVIELIQADETTAIYSSLEDAVAAATDGATIKLLANHTEDVVNVNANVVLDLNGYTLTVNSISGNVMDSADGKGLIKTGEKNAVLTAADDQLILWDNAADASGYRLFDYTFTNEGVDRNKNKDDAASSEDMGTTVKSFWSDLSFTNSYAYTLVGSTYAGLEVGFEVSWTPVGGETTNKTFALDADTIQAWAEAEFGKTVEDYCFFVQLTDFEDLPTDGVVTVKPYAKTAFQTLTEVEATEYEHEYVEPVIPGLIYEIGFGVVPAL